MNFISWLINLKDLIALYKSTPVHSFIFFQGASMSSQHYPYKPNVRLHANVYSLVENVSNFTPGKTSTAET